MDIKIVPVDCDKFDSLGTGVTILPANFNADKADDYSYHSTTPSFYKYAENKVEISCLSKPTRLIEQRCGDWFAPTLLFTSTAIVANPQIVSIVCGVISNYIFDYFKGAKKPNVRLKVLHKQSKASSLTEMNYDGPVEGLSKFADAVLEISKGASRDA